VRSKLVLRKMRPVHVAVGAVALAAPGSAVALAAGQADAQSANSGGASALASKPPRGLTSAARFAMPAANIRALGTQPLHIRGRLLPAVAGRMVTLIGSAGRSWHTLARSRTGRHGGFDLRFTAPGTDRQRLRVRFAGDRLNGGSSAYAGTVTAFRQSTASWYDDGGGTACGFHAHYGVANRTLPCGTKVSFYYGGRSVTAVVDDRGPFVSGRDWDLNQNTAGALGFGGVDSLWASR